MVNDTMRGLFFIIKGAHAWKKEPAYTNRVTGDEGHIGGYNPYDENTKDWWEVLDRKSYNCIYCGNSLEDAIDSVRKCIVKHKGVAKNYFKEVSRLTSDDYYEVHYLGRPELTPEKRAKKQEGRCPRTSPIMMDMYRNIDMRWGEYYQDEVEQMEEVAYTELIEERPVNRSRRIVQNARKKLVKTPQVEETPVQKKEVKRLKKSTPKKKEDITPIAIRRAKKSVKLLRV